MAMVKFENVFKSFGKKCVLEDVSFEIKKGDFCILVGHNGVGKSTILNLMVQNQFQDEGNITFLSKELNQVSVFHEGRFAFVHEKLEFKLPYKTETFIDMIKTQFPNWNQKLFEQMVFERGVDLKQNFSQYSRGQKMQLALIISIARNPDVFLLDEITSVLDISAQKYFLSLLRELTENGATVILTTNIISEVQNFCNQIVYLDHGKVVFSGKREVLLERYVKMEIPNYFLEKEVIPEDVTLLEKKKNSSVFIFAKDRIKNTDFNLCKIEVPTLEELLLHFHGYKKNENAA